jgi:hypothetical protein|tara:strand:+ start:6183 stop:6467 length:285 start_codon:yes stop_codon:yes gene_type:complete
MKKTEIADINSIATAMTLSDTQKQELKDEWGKLQVLVKVSEKEKFDSNKLVVQSALSKIADLDARIKMIELYMGSLKNRVEEVLQQRDDRHNQE